MDVHSNYPLLPPGGDRKSGEGDGDTQAPPAQKFGVISQG